MVQHAKTLFQHSYVGKLAYVNNWTGTEPAPQFYLARSESEVYYAFHESLDLDSRSALEELVRSEPQTPREAPIHAEMYAEILGEARTWTGPAYYFDNRRTVRSLNPNIIQITAENVGFLKPYMTDWLADVDHEQPMMAWIDEGSAVGICSSVRIGVNAMEAGVEVLASHRQRGIGLSLVYAWAKAVQSLGKIAMYSTSNDNQLSQQLANSLGLIYIGSDFHITKNPNQANQ